MSSVMGREASAKSGGEGGEPAVIALVGHCGPDSMALRSAVGWAVPGARMEMIDNEAELEASLGRVDLLLVNRVLDGGFGGASGVELIRKLARRSVGPSLMLVSNYPEAQAEAERAGAMPGFGKAQQRSEPAADRMRASVTRARERRAAAAR